MSALLLLCSLAISIRAYPGALQARAEQMSRDPAPESSQSIAPPEQQRTYVATETDMYPESAYSEDPNDLTSAFHTQQSSFLSLDPLDIIEHDTDDIMDDEDDEEECVNDGTDLNRREDSASCSRAMSTIMMQLQTIVTMLHGLETPLQKRQLDDAINQGETYGNQGKDLTQEQKASLEALVKGLNGYQASLDGATNTQATEQEIGRQSKDAEESSAPLLPALTSAEVESILAFSGLIQHQRRPSKPSSTTLGSQAGESVSQSSWLVPEQSTIRGTGSSTISDLGATAESTSPPSNAAMLILLNRLQELRELEQQLLSDLRNSSDSTSNQQPLNSMLNGVGPSS